MRGAVHEMSPEESAELLTQAFSNDPFAALGRSSGRFQTLLEWLCMRSIVARADRRSIRRSNLRFRFDQGSNRLSTIGRDPLVIPFESMRFSDSGELANFSISGIPLDEVIFEFRERSSSEEGWRLTGYSLWSNTTIQFYGSSSRLTRSNLVSIHGRPSVVDLDNGSSFSVGGERCHVVGTLCTFSTISILELKATQVKRQTLGSTPASLTLELPGDRTVQLDEFYAPPFATPFEVRLH